MKHGVYVREQKTSVSTPVVAESGVPFVVGTAPVHSAESPAALFTPVLCTDWEDAVKKLGYSDDWKTYTICEVMYSHFKLFQRQPIIFCNVLDPSTNKEAVAARKSPFPASRQSCRSTRSCPVSLSRRHLRPNRRLSKTRTMPRTTRTATLSSRRSRTAQPRPRPSCISATTRSRPPTSTMMTSSRASKPSTFAWQPSAPRPTSLSRPDGRIPARCRPSWRRRPKSSTAFSAQSPSAILTAPPARAQL